MSVHTCSIFSNAESMDVRELTLTHHATRSTVVDASAHQLKDRTTLLYEELRVPVLRYLLCSRISREDAEEMVQETFLRLYRHLQKGGGEDNLRGWLFRVAHNLACTSRKTRKLEFNAAEEQWERISFSLRDPHAGPEELLLRQERMAHLHQGIAELSQLQRNCLLLRVEGFRYREIAEILNVTSSTVAGSLRHAIEKLAREQ